MKTPEIFNRNELSRTLWEFRREFVVAGVFSMVANLLMLAPTMYMLQIYDRVMVSQSSGTLLVVSLITLFFFGVLTPVGAGPSANGGNFHVVFAHFPIHFDRQLPTHRWFPVNG